jgi:DNA-binding transcriptional LysR family regulator
LNDLAAFVIVARERSFTRAAAQLGVSQSALSHTMRGLEERLGLRLLTRTTRSVKPTDAGERLLATWAPRLEAIDSELADLGRLRDRPAGDVRITADEYSARAVLWPALRQLLTRYPDIAVEIVTDYGLTDIVAERYDAGVRLGGLVAKDMIAVPIAPDMRMIVIAAPAYLAGRPTPKTPQDLTGHSCINLRLPTYGGVYAWEFAKDGRELRVRVEGQVIFNSGALHRPWRSHRTASRLDSILPRLPPLLPQPPSADAGVRGGGGGAAVSGVRGCPRLTQKLQCQPIQHPTTFGRRANTLPVEANQTLVYKRCRIESDQRLEIG